MVEVLAHRVVARIGWVDRGDRWNGKYYGAGEGLSPATQTLHFVGRTSMRS